MKNETRECPFCKEEIKTEAVKCKHCCSSIQPLTQPHDGTCPYCKETINPAAIKCKHCKSNLDSDATCGCHGSDFEIVFKKMQAMSYLEPHGPYQDCYIDCSRYPEGSHDRTNCYKYCDTFVKNPLTYAAIARLFLR